jgi:hypothetical protein
MINKYLQKNIYKSYFVRKHKFTNDRLGFSISNSKPIYRISIESECDYIKKYCHSRKQHLYSYEASCIDTPRWCIHGNFCLQLDLVQEKNKKI